MNQAKAIAVAAIVIGACVLTHLAYTVYHDRAVAETARQENARRLLEQEKALKALAENQRRIQSKETWKQALKFIDVAFKQWLTKQTKLDKNHILVIRWAWVKAFDLPDIDWHDAHTVTVHGILGASSEADGSNEHRFFWTRNLYLKSDGVDSWWQSDDPQFESVTLSSDQEKHILTQTIVMPGKEIELVR
jgi:hypothetical protein